MRPDPATLRARCPRCGTELWDIRGGQPTLANAIVKVRGDGSIAARCPRSGCSEDVPIPFLELVEPPTPAPGPRLRVRRRIALDVDTVPRNG